MCQKNVKLVDSYRFLYNSTSDYSFSCCTVHRRPPLISLLLHPLALHTPIPWGAADRCHVHHDGVSSTGQDPGGEQETYYLFHQQDVNLLDVKIKCKDDLFCFLHSPSRWLFHRTTCIVYAFCGVLFGLCSLTNLTVLSSVCWLKVCCPNYGKTTGFIYYLNNNTHQH